MALARSQDGVKADESPAEKRIQPRESLPKLAVGVTVPEGKSEGR